MRRATWNLSLTTRRVAAPTLALLLVAACSDSADDGTEPEAVTVETTVSPQLVLVGQSFEISCAAANAQGTPIKRDFTVKVDPTLPVTSYKATPTTKGTYYVACALADGSRQDKTPAVVYALTQDEMDRVSIDTALGSSKVDVGGSTDATCKVALDGKPLSDLVTTVEAIPSDVASVADHKVTGKRDGEAMVACGIQKTVFKDKTPALLVVGKGDPKPVTVVTTLSKTTAASGDTVDVTCTVLDSAGTQLQVDTVVDAPTGIGLQGKKLTAQQAGKFTITCKLADATKGTPELKPATIEVTAGSAETVEAWAEPKQPAYKPGDQVTIKWTAFDTFKNPIADAPATITAPATGVTKKTDVKFSLDQDGYYTFKVTVTTGGKPSAEVKLVVDGAGPKVIILTPERGQTLTGNTDIKVTGKVEDNFGVQKLVVNGKLVSFDEATGTFTLTIPSVHGMNVVVAEATDKNGNTGKANVAWYFSSKYQPTDEKDTAAALLTNQVRIWLSQQILDDGDHTEPKADDIATILEIILTNVDVAALLGKPALVNQTIPIINQNIAGVDIKGNGKLSLTVATAKFGKVGLTLKSRDGGIDMTATFKKEGAEPGLTIGLDAFLGLILSAEANLNIGLGIPNFQLLKATVVPPPGVNTTTTLTIDELQIFASFDIATVNGQLQVTGKDLKLSPKGISLAPFANAFIDLGTVQFSALGGLFTTSIPLGIIDLNGLLGPLSQAAQGVLDPLLNGIGGIFDLLTSFLGPYIANFLAPAVQSMLESLAIDQQIAIPELIPGQPKSTVHLRAEIGSVAFTKAGGDLGLDAFAVAPKKVDRNPLGSVLRDHCLGADPGDFQTPKAGPMALGIGMDVINQILFSAWYTGGLNLTIDGTKLGLGTTGLTKADLKLDPLLPPILDDCNSKQILGLQLGDAHLTADLKLGDLPIKFKAWLSLQADVTLKAENDALGLNIIGVSVFEIQVYDVEGAFAGQEAALEGLVKDMLVKQLLAKLTGGALTSIPIPSIDLSGLAPGIPPGTEIKLGDLALTKKDGFLAIEGNLK